MNRRDFLLHSSAAAAFAATPGLAFSQLTGNTAPFNDYRALVCVFLFGGSDSFNMLVPSSDAEYAEYSQSRQNLAVAKDQLLPIAPMGVGSGRYGLHPAMTSLQQLFEAGAASFVTNVGPLIEPTTKADFFNRSVALPPQLFSHNDQQDQWNSLKGIGQTKTGWSGRMADLIRTNVAGQKMATNASLFGANLLQSADESVAYVMGPDGPQPFFGFSDDPNDPGFAQRQVFQRIVDAEYDSVYERAFAEVQRRAIAAVDTVSNALASAPEMTTVFPGSQLGRQLETVAKLVAVRDELEMQRQIFFVGTGGFDSHDNQNAEQPGLFSDVSESMAAFYRATVELGVSDRVTSFTQSDFGRTLTSNGDGTDHAWGGNQIVLGDSVHGRDIFGQYPLLQIDSDEDLSGGRMIPSTSADQYAATLAGWFGIPDADLETVAPHLGNFAVRDLGFMV